MRARFAVSRVFIGWWRIASSVAFRSWTSRAFALLTALIAVAGPVHLLPGNGLDAKDFPETDGIVLATLPVRVTPARELIVNAPITGELALEVIEPRTMQAQARLWGRIDPERISLEAEMLELKKRQLEKKEIPEWTLAQQQEKKRLEEELRKLEAELRLLRRIEADPDLADLYLEDLAAPPADDAAPGGDGDSGEADPGEAVASLMARVNQDIALIRKRLDYVGTEEQAEIEVGLLRRVSEQVAMDFKRKREQTTLTMPFTGELELLVPVPDSPTQAIPVEAGQELARIRDFTRIEVQAPVDDPRWRLLNPGQLEARFYPMGPGKPVIAAFRGRQNIIRQGREELVYLFQFAEEDRETARRLIGGLVTCDLFFRADVRRVPKLKLAMAHPDAIRQEGWQAAVEQAFSGYRLICIGQNAIGIAPVD